ncbi:FAD-dependent oxidoreductase [uncultured Paludibaculum sp.]|uniref:FAD-dependent oxidoreductase n=1 Tax=uncultured Paludibaculum sp. TaxID=1765020 RepID=UPI002AAB5731|nr:FAD-dependent oxidoreductase [uncultured Paludibaculum sp.]
MFREPGVPGTRAELCITLDTDLAIAGGGLAGTCAAITAARAGLRVVLVQDRPVLGGNASSEVRLWILGATSHMGNNNRWAREGGVVDEILIENLHRNPEGNALILDTILLEKVIAEPSITLLLNTAVYEVEKSAPDTISALRAWCSQNSTVYVVKAPCFCDASGDGVVGFLAGAAFRMGAEPKSEFGEGFAPDAGYGELLGHSMYFYSKDTGRPVRFTAPSFALKDISTIPRYRDIKASDSGCRFWWFEYGGRLDTVHQTEAIKWELWRVIYGAWDYIKNSGQFPEADTMTLEWVGTIPGKRESRRFEGDYILTQQDLVEQRAHPDAVAVGGWAMDLHPADGVYSRLSPCTQWHSKGVYQIPYRCLYSRNIGNLFLAGRIISVSHVAFGSTRVMATCAHTAQAVGLAAALCRQHGVRPAQVPVAELQRALGLAGQYIPGFVLDDTEDWARRAAASASSSFVLDELKPSGATAALDVSRAMLVPVPAGQVPAVTFLVDVAQATTLELEVRCSERVGNFTPDRILHRESVSLEPGIAQPVTLRTDLSLVTPAYLFFTLLRNAAVSVHVSEARLTGVLSLTQSMNAAVAKGVRQEPPEGSGIDSFEFWLPARRPGGLNLATRVAPPLAGFEASNVTNGIARPTVASNAWVAGAGATTPRLTLTWAEPVTIGRVELVFDTDFDHPLESVLWGHPERDIPFCVRHYRILNAEGAVLYECLENHQTRNSVRFAEPVSTTALHVEVISTHGAPAAIFEVRCYLQ